MCSFLEDAALLRASVLTFMLRLMRRSMRSYGRASVLLASALCLVSTQAQTQSFEGTGRAATTAEVKAWDIDVRPDFKGPPCGQGSVKRGEEVWEARCTSCHGTFGESNDVLTPLIGYTTNADIQTGQVVSLKPVANTPTRTTMMELAQLSTLWDYIHRAMPWATPKSLNADDVYAVTAYMLNLSNVGSQACFCQTA
jgi:hypothetical protein